MIAADYPFLDVVWTMVIFFIWIMWFMLLFRVFGDIFQRHDLSGLGKTGWLIFTILVPFLGVFIYIVANNDGMNQRSLDRAKAQRAQFTSRFVPPPVAVERQPRSSARSSCSTPARSRRPSSTLSSRRR